MAGDEPRSVFDFENIPSLNSYHSYSSSSSSSQPKIQLKEWSMVVIRDSSLPNGDFSVFPPSNHENLQPPSIQREIPASFRSNSPPPSFTSSQSSSSLSSSSFSDDETSNPPSPKPSDVRTRKSMVGFRWMAFGVQILRSRIASMASSIWVNTARRTAFWVFSPAGRIGILLTLWWLYRRARQRRLRQSTEQLKMMIKDRDEKISELLQQVALLNRSLSAQQKVVVVPSN